VSKAARQRRRAAEAAVRAGRPSLSGWRHPSLVSALVAFVVYAPSLLGGFVYDDQTVIVTNPYIRHLSAWRTVLLYEPSRPLLNLTWAVNYAISGLTAWPYHLVNVLLHAGNAALVASLFLWMARRLEWPDADKRALLGACLFAASPMAAETVAYATSRSTALVSLFALASLRVTVPVLAGGPRARLAPGLGFFLLALATKEEAAAVPLLLLLLDYFFVAGRRAADLKTRLWLHLPFVGLLPVGLLARRVVTGSWLPPPDIDTSQYLLTQLAAFPLYFLRALVPIDPALYRHHLPSPWPPDAPTAIGLAATLALLAAAFVFRRRQPEWSFAILCLAAGLLPSSSIVALKEMVVDHRAYLGAFGILFALASVLWRAGGARLACVVVAVLAVRAVHYEWVLHDPVRTWEDAVRRSPNAPDALCALGEAYSAAGDARAESAFRRATQLNPGNSRYWANLGVYYAERQRAPEAVAAMHEAARTAPDDAIIRDYYATLLQGAGRIDEAAAELEAAAAADRSFVQPRVHLAELLLARGDAARARLLVDEAARLPTTPEEAEAIEALRRRLP
jgi:Flp pilus assembly protein TadD